MNSKSVKKSTRTSIGNGVTTTVTTIVTTEGGKTTTETITSTKGDNDHKDHYCDVKNKFEGFKIDAEQEKPKEKKVNIPTGVEFIDGSLERHNYYRKMHHAEPLVHNPELSKLAQAYADTLASKNVMQHSNCKWGNKQVGENLAMCSGYVMSPEHSCDVV